MKKWFVRGEDFDSHVNTLTIKYDRIPNPSKETRETDRVSVRAHRWVALNFIGQWYLRWMWQARNFKCPASLTDEGRILSIYPLPNRGD